MTQHRWCPIAGTQDATDVWDAVYAIARDLAPDKIVSSSKRGVPTDDSLGAALFFTYLFESVGNEEWADAAVRWLDHAVETLAGNDMIPALHGGFAGIGWVSEHLGPRLFETNPAGEDVNAEIDEALLRAVALHPWSGSYDLIQGLAGLGVYFLERFPRGASGRGLHEIVLRLEDLSESCDGGTRWLTKPEDVPIPQRGIFPQGHYNLGVAHGTPAVIGLLAAACKAQISPKTTPPLLSSAIRGLLNTRFPEGSGCMFPSLITREGAKYPSRLAWCYGDAGIATLLLAAARVAQNADWERDALEAAQAAAQRTLENGTQISDPDLCHGAAGLLHIFNRLYQATHEDLFQEAAKVWLKKTLGFREPGSWIGGFWGLPFVGLDSTSLAPPKKAPARGLLEGASGVGLALLATCTDVAPDWDRLLMMSLRQFDG